MEQDLRFMSETFKFNSYVLNFSNSSLFFVCLSVTGVTWQVFQRLSVEFETSFHRISSVLFWQSNNEVNDSCSHGGGSLLGCFRKTSFLIGGLPKACNIQRLWSKPLLLRNLRVSSNDTKLNWNSCNHLFSFRGPQGPACQRDGCTAGCFCNKDYILNVANQKCIKPEHCKVAFGS